jgi:putative glycosyltransferase (TIGR04372 family)
MFNNLLYLIYKNLKILILFPHPTAIGNCAEDIYEALRVAQLHQRRVLLLLPIRINFKLIPFRTVDPTTFDLESKLFFVAPLSLMLLPIRIIIWGLSFPFIVLWLVLKWIKVPVPNWGLFPYAGQKIIFNNFDEVKFCTPTIEDCILEATNRTKIKGLGIKIRKENQEAIMNFRKSAGLLGSNWFACLHVRTSDYYGNTFESGYRNAKIETYSKLVEKICERGGKVIRIGDKKMPKIANINKFENYDIFDLANSDYNSGIINSWVIANCAFYVGMQSGPFDLARLFQKPILLTNMYTPFFGIDNDNFIRGVYKNFVDLNTGDKLNTSDVIKKSNFNGDFSPKEVIFFDNTEEQLALFLDESISKNGNLKPRVVGEQYIETHNDRMLGLIKSGSADQKSIRWILRSLYL